MEDKEKRNGMNGSKCEECGCSCGSCSRGMYGCGCGGCGCGGCGSYGGWGWRRRHHFGFLRVILLLIILSIVFSFGVKLGEFKGAVGGYYGHPMMRGNYFYEKGNPSMMGPGWGYPTQSLTAPGESAQ